MAASSARPIALCVSLSLAAFSCATSAAGAQVPNPNPKLIARWEPCAPKAGVTVIVDDATLGEGKVYVGCALGEQPDGVEALKQAGFTPEGTLNYGLQFICRIDGEPTQAEQACATTPPLNAYWSYWRGMPGETWSYSKFGASSEQTRSPVNSVEGWAFGAGLPPRIGPVEGESPNVYEVGFGQQSLSFETRPVGSASAPLTGTLTNRDARGLTVGAVEVVGAQAADFSVGADGCAGRALASQQSCEVSVSFDPSVAGVLAAQLQAAIQGSEQAVDLPLSGTGSAVAAAGVLGAQEASFPLVQSLRLDGEGANRGLVGVSWRVLQQGAAAAALMAWTIAAKPLGSGVGYSSRATGAGSVTSALLKLPPGYAYELEITFTDVLGRSATRIVGRALVPNDDRWSGLHYRGRWRRLDRPAAWLGTVTRGSAGAEVSARLPAGAPVWVLRATSANARVELLAGVRRHQFFTVAKGAAGTLRELTAATRARRGTVSLRVLEGTVDLDGVAVEG